MKELFSIILSLSLVGTGIPDLRGEQYLAPPVLNGIINNISNKKTEIIDVFNNFNSKLDAIPGDCNVEMPSAGLMNFTCYLTHEPTGKKYIIQRLNTIFDINAIDHNLQLFEQAQNKSFDKDIVPSYWQKVLFLSVKGSSNKIYYDESGSAWRVMEFIPGEIYTFEFFNDIPMEDRRNAAVSLGKAIAVFEKMVNSVPQEQWKTPLPNYHNQKYHMAYLDAILRGAEVTKSLSQDPTRKVRKQPHIMEKYKDRINALRQKIEQRQDLARALEKLGYGITHGDLKLDNAIFRRGKEGTLQCVCLIDLDTVQAGNVLDDIGDALRSAGNPAGEVPADIDDVRVDSEVVSHIIDGYVQGIEEKYDKKRSIMMKKHVYRAFKLFLLQQCIRFFADALVGNEYYGLKTGQPEDINLYRAEVQMRVLEKLEKMQASIREPHQELIIKNAQRLVEFAVKNDFMYKKKASKIKKLNEILITIGIFLEEVQLNSIKWAEPEEHIDTREAVNKLIEYAASQGLINDGDIEQRDFLESKLMGVITPKQKQFQLICEDIYKKEGLIGVIKYLYNVEIPLRYIRKERQEQNIVLDPYRHQKTGVNFIVTVNLSKPEIKADSVGKKLDKKCSLCIKRVGSVGKENMVAFIFKIGATDVFIHLSSYPYSENHAMLNYLEHTPMRIDDDTVDDLFNIVDASRGKIIAVSNTDKEGTGCSILDHRHYQLSSLPYPAFEAKSKWTAYLDIENSKVKAEILNYPAGIMRVSGTNEAAVKHIVKALNKAWKGFSSEEMGIDNNKNTAGLALWQKGKKYGCYLVWRNSSEKFRTKDENKIVKEEFVGILEMLGYGILPGRLAGNIERVEKILRRKIQEVFIDIISDNSPLKNDAEGLSAQKELIDKAVEILNKSEELAHKVKINRQGSSNTGKSH